MDNQVEMQRLIDDLVYVKAAINKANNILKYVDVTRILSIVLLVSGIIITLFAAGMYALIQYYGNYAAIPQSFKTLIYISIAVTAIMVSTAKIKLVVRQFSKSSHDMTVQRLIREIYTAQTLNVLIPFLTVIVLVTVFLVRGGHVGFIVPTLAILFGLFFIAFVNIFYMHELLVMGDWLLGTGLISMFAVRTLHPLLALILTFGLGLPTMFVSNRMWRKKHE